MQNGSNPLPPVRSNKSIWIIIAVVGVGVALGCLILAVGAGVFLFRSFGNNTIAPLKTQTAPTISTSPAIPTATSQVEQPTILDYEADPLFGSIKLERGFIPDPHVVAMVAGGTVNTADLDIDCGFTSSFPTFAFDLRGGASETFLRIFYTANDGTDTTMVIYTPEKKWVCLDDSMYGSKKDPVIDIEYAQSGKYVIWIGTKQSDIYAGGNLFITGSTNSTP